MPSVAKKIRNTVKTMVKMAQEAALAQVQFEATLHMKLDADWDHEDQLEATITPLEKYGVTPSYRKTWAKDAESWAELTVKVVV